ncbi:MAG: ABC transporter ATP-binding protein [Bacteroidota bacterium]
MDKEAIVVSNLSKRFGKFVAVDGISFHVRKGEIYGFLGPNGAGKSTTIRMLCGLLMPSSGTAIVAGFDVRRESESVKEHIGYMSQRFSLYEDLTVEENILFYGGIYGLSNAPLEQRKEWVLGMAGLTGKEQMMTRDLAGGWKQRLALGCAMLHEPEVIFLDEPTAGVSPVSRRSFWNLIHEMSQRGTTIFVTTHYLDEAEYCNTIGLIYAGRLISQGSPRKLKEQLSEYQIFEIRGTRIVEGMEILQDQPWVAETSIFGTAMHISVSGIRDAERRIRRTLSSQDIDVHSVQTISPSLEDVFLHLIASEDSRRQTGDSTR